MRPAGGRLPLDPATHHTSKAIFGATRGAGSVSGASIPTALLFLVALAVLLPALSFLSLHTKVLSSQRIISDHYAVRSPANPRAPLPSPPRRFKSNPARFTSNRLVSTPRARDASEPSTSSHALHPPQTTMVELTALREEIGEVRAVTSELRDARTELTNARVSLGEVARRVAGAEGAKATPARRVLRVSARGSYGDEDAEVVSGDDKIRAPRRAGPGRETRGGSIERGAMPSARTRRRR